MADEDQDEIDFSKMKKKKKPKAGPTPAKKEINQAQDADNKYDEMLTRIFERLRKTKGGGGSTDNQRCIVKQPEVVRIGSKKTGWVNFQDICDMLKRPSDHMSRFFFVELGTDGSITQDLQLIFKGRYLEKQIEFLLKKYITEYVLCQNCKSMQTILTRDSSIRMFTMKCEKCECTRSVQQIKEGYHHQTKADRKKAKMAN
ncbi:unnamed protein product [Blepharisma stoltei]|uniref:Translation initiation factor IF2/IF5 domain-containing protein n=1 Tax=Blepharisma stoltei TaxID=1481888 RepID=A0AAU9ILK7_9CILI|nr:unnamed protein product [Blepharisma stoltei]